MHWMSRKAMTLLIEAAKPRHRLYNISTGVEWAGAANGARSWPALHSGFVCRLAKI